MNQAIRFVLFFFIIPVVQAQPEFLSGYFRSPLDIPIYLSGNFGELRSNHFHAGIDIKTQGATGHRVYAAAEGYISRIKIEAAGYGNTLYITHSQGYTTVYGHLDRFRSDLNKYVRKRQYENRRHALNIYPGREEWPVKKGEFIAFSGTSGYSFGPHLHFEIRNAARQEPMNVLLFGLEIEDDVPPKIFSLYVYPKSNDGLVNHSRKKLRFEVKGEGSQFSLMDEDTLMLNGWIGFGIEAYDYLNGAHNRCGLYSLIMQVDGQPKFHWEMQQFSFSESRYINSYIDYEEKVKNRISVQKAFVDPNNHLGLYKYVDQGGLVEFSEKSIHRISFLLEDAHGNRSKLEFAACGGMQNSLNAKSEPSSFSEEFSCMVPNVFMRRGLELRIPEGALYKDLKFKFARTDPLPGTHSPLYHLHNPYTPLHLDCTLAIEPDGVPDSLRSKALIGIINGSGKIEPIGGDWVEDRVVAEIRQLGRFTVILDTIPPVIRPLNLNQDMRGQESVNFRVIDEVSGIRSYEGYIDNDWVLFEYDMKNDLVYYTFDPDRINREILHELELFITDNKDNISYFYTEFYW